MDSWNRPTELNKTTEANSNQICFVGHDDNTNIDVNPTTNSTTKRTHAVDLWQ